MKTKATTDSPPYPATAVQRTQWILAHRPPRNLLNPWRPAAVCTELERAESGEVAEVLTIFLVNRECPWRCVYCDLWQNTLERAVAPGMIPAQIDSALRELAARPSQHRHPRYVKLYNAGSFFDPKAILPDEHPVIAKRLRGFHRVIIESHPALVGRPAVWFRDLLATDGGGTGRRLEVAMGLETVDPAILPRLNKRMTLDQFRGAAEFLRAHEIALRVFILVKPPWTDEQQALSWACRSLEFAFDCGASVAVLIPVRAGNGALDLLAARGEFAPPRLATLEAALAHGIALRRGRVFADLWDISRLRECATCFDARVQRLKAMNFSQEVLTLAACAQCGGGRQKLNHPAAHPPAPAR